MFVLVLFESVKYQNDFYVKCCKYLNLLKLNFHGVPLGFCFMKQYFFEIIYLTCDTFITVLYTFTTRYTD